jgi:hypothetical protein
MGLVEFDRSQAWGADGQRSCAAWMSFRLGMARSTAFEKLRVAYAIESRPVLLEAFSDGRMSYSMVRAVARIDNPGEEVDEAFVNLATAEGATIHDIERLVEYYLLHYDQHQPPPDPDCRRQLSVRRDIGGGLGRITITLSQLEIEEFLLTLKAFDDPLFREAAQQKPGEPDGPDPEHGAEQPVDESTTVDSLGWRDTGTRAARRANAFMDLLAAALAGEGGGHAAGADRYLLNVVTVVGAKGAAHLNGDPITSAEMETVACDCSRVAHTVTEEGETLHLGRKTREWSTAQRRAINVRDGGRCRFPGCESPYVDIHHIQWWERGGPTDVHNGVNQCRWHHGLIHRQGFQVEGSPNGELRFKRSDGSLIGVTRPVLATRLHLPFAS